MAHLVYSELVQDVFPCPDAGGESLVPNLLDVAGDVLHPGPLVDHQSGVAVVEPGDKLDPGQPDGNTPDSGIVASGMRRYFLPGVDVESTKQHHGDDHDGGDGQGDVDVGSHTGQEVSK